MAMWRALPTVTVWAISVRELAILGMEMSGTKMSSPTFSLCL
jgi:hypothetical protein